MDASKTLTVDLLEEKRICERVFADLKDPASSVRAAAAYTLGQYGGAHAVTLLLDALTDEDAVVREEAAYALGELGDLRAVTLLLDARNHDPNQEVRRTAAAALHRLRYRIAQGGSCASETIPR